MTNDTTKHTPGPWLIREGDQVITGGGLWHAHEWPSTPETLANARLIAAAPDLLAALENYMSQFGQALDANGIDYGPAQHAADAAARAAIAKATGDDNLLEELEASVEALS